MNCLQCNKNVDNDPSTFVGRGYVHLTCHNDYLRDINPLNQQREIMDPYNQIMHDAIALHDRKVHDYATTDNRFSNFTRAAEVVSWFKNPIDQVFACMIAIKLARTAELRNGKSPNNESIRDTDVDRINYEALWGAFYDSLPKPLFQCRVCGNFHKSEEILVEHVRQNHSMEEIARTNY